MKTLNLEGETVDRSRSTTCVEYAILGDNVGDNPEEDTEEDDFDEVEDVDDEEEKNSFVDSVVVFRSVSSFHKLFII